MSLFRRLAPLLGILLLTAASIVIVWPSEPDRFLPDVVPWPEGRGIKIGDFSRDEMRLGLDLQGGTRLLLRASLPAGEQGDLEESMDGTLSILRKRVDSAGVSEAEVTRQGSDSISIQIPGLTPEEARSLLGRTALLRFCEAAGPEIDQVGACDANGQWQVATADVDGERVPLTSRYLRPNAYVNQDALGNPLVVFEWEGAGRNLSEQVTGRLVGRQMAIFLDNELLSAPVVNSVIRDSGQITGLDFNRARELVDQLNAGALDVQLTVIQEQQVDATLGEDSVQRSVLAGEIGMLLVVLFMVLYYACRV